ncbi:hypothetical protein QFZ75_007918 [Streptomyces sp. V3I8]|uniref:hypothetical protein n=1 Tax=Streptomyces sp. V3I8 TaxID=3042279 RepID=UPI00277F9C2A|nr:hypothetical protein [Streptomyces sp. V3I8]MDQ1041416.1 hypothetical protein [Streptomyces sp. V3I8]
MARAHVMRPIIGENGDLLYGATVTVREAGLSVRLAQALYAGPTGAAQLSNPHVATSGLIDFWVEVPQRVSVLVQRDQHSDILVYLDAGAPPEETARTDTPLLITGSQVPGNVLMAGNTPGQAVWGAPTINAGVTPLVTVLSEAFALARDPAGWTFTQAANSARDYTDAVPEGQGYTKSLRARHTGNSGNFAAVSPGFTLTEPGFVSMWLRPSLTTGESAVIAVTNQANVKTVLQTITTTRDWGFYRFPLAAGTYKSVSVEFPGAAIFTGSTGHEIWVTGLKAQYGGLVPAHTHSGAGANSVLLGPAAAAAGVNAVAVGSAATASGLNSVAFGRQSQATAEDATAIGPEAKAVAEDAVAVGVRATGSLASTGWTAVGAEAYADANESTAIGHNARAYGLRSAAVGANAYVGPGADNALALGQNAQALAGAAVAIGINSVVAAGHTASTAIGESASTTGAGQIMLGSANTAYRMVIALGRLYAVGAVNLGTDATSRLGFYGSEGTIKPVVTGSDGGNIALRNLLAALAGLGLITNSTTT